MSTKMKPALVPKLRFPEFRDADPWKDVPIDGILVVRDERRVPSEEAPLFSLTIESGITEKTDRYNREFLVRDTGKKYKLVEPNDIVYNPSNLRWGAINYSQLSHSVVVSPIYEVLSLGDESKHCLEFIASAAMRSEQIRRFITKAQGTLVERIAVKIEDFRSTKLPVPPTRTEQKKIADCLSSVDELMATQARKVDALKTHKKGLMQQLFPREGENQPRLRFPEFQNAGEWKVKAIDDVFQVTRGEVLAMTLVKDEASNEMPYPVYSSQTKSKGLAGYYSDYLYRDAITWTTDGANAGDVNFRSGRFYCTNVCGVLLNTDGYANECIAAMLNTVTRSHVSYVGNPKLMNGVMAKIKIPFPSVAEQQRIAECLGGLDDLIAAEMQNLEILKTHKKGLMQQLFPSPEEN